MRAASLQNNSLCLWTKYISSLVGYWQSFEQWCNTTNSLGYNMLSFDMSIYLYSRLNSDRGIFVTSTIPKHHSMHLSVPTKCEFTPFPYYLLHHFFPLFLPFTVAGGSATVVEPSRTSSSLTPTSCFSFSPLLMKKLRSRFCSCRSVFSAVKD